jgi:hypothetical protein
MTIEQMRCAEAKGRQSAYEKFACVRTTVAKQMIF